MNGFAQTWGDLLPLRWYVEILFDQAVRGLPTSVSVPPFAVLGGLAFGLSFLSWLRLRSIAHSIETYHAPAPAPVATAPPVGVGATLVAEVRQIVTDSGVFGLIVLAPLIYGVFYPQPYLGQLLRKLPIAVVDQDHSELSRNFIQDLNADEALEIVDGPATLVEARDALARRQVFGIVDIPEETERDVLKGDRARIAVYVDSAYFLLYSRILEGISGATQAAGLEIAAHGARSDGSLAHVALIRSSPVELLTEPLYNPTGGYASYLVPAAFVLILQQTLFMGAATVGGVAFEQGGRMARRRRSDVRALIGQALAHLCLAMPGLALYLIILPRVYGFSTLGSPLDLLSMAIPFVLSVSFLAQLVAAGFKRRESAVLVFMATSLPLFFLVGVSWPVEALPNALREASRIFPSTSAIDGLVRINQMGATLHDVSRDWVDLWILTGVYAALAIIMTRLFDRREAPLER
jgi:ABC-2 type transport system permease protein